MKVKCINNYAFENRLTIDKEYDVLDTEKYMDYILLYKVLDDIMRETWFYADRFVIVEE